MPISLSINADEQLIIVKLFGIVLPSDLMKLIREADNHPSFSSQMDRLTIVYEGTDLSSIDSAALAQTKSGVIEVEAHHADDEQVLRFKTAFVVPPGANANIAHLFKAHWEADSIHKPELQIFETTETALKWLGKNNLEIV